MEKERLVFLNFCRNKFNYIENTFEFLNLEMQYAKRLAETILSNTYLNDRTNTGILIGEPTTLIYDNIGNQVPKLVGKAVYPHLAFKEMIWFLKGNTDKESLNKLGVHYWDPWFNEEGNIGKSYGYQFNNHNQLTSLLQELISNPYSRRLLINLWNTQDLNEMVLPPCFYNYQFSLAKDIYDEEKGKHTYYYNLVVTSRSADAFIGVPYNFMSSWFLGNAILSYLSGVTDNSYQLNKIVWNIANFHVYKNHIEQSANYIQNLDNIAEFNILEEMNIDQGSWHSFTAVPQQSNNLLGSFYDYLDELNTSIDISHTNKDLICSPVTMFRDTPIVPNKIQAPISV